MTADDADGIEVDLRQLWAAIFRNKWQIAAIMLVMAIIATVITTLSTRIYQASSSVQIEQVTQRILDSDSVDQSYGYGESTMFLQTQVDIIKSRALAEQVADKLKLAKDNTFLEKMGGAPPVQGSTSSLEHARRNAVISTLLGNLQVSLPRNSRIVTISFLSPDPDTARKIADAYVEGYIEQNLQRKFAASAYARKFLSEQLQLTKQRLEASEMAMLSYARSAGLLDTAGASGAGQANSGGGASRSLALTDLVTANDALNAARAARVKSQQRWEVAEKTPLLSLTEVQSNSAIQQLQKSKADAQALLAKESIRYQDDYPSVRQAKSQVTTLETQIDRLARSIRDSIRDDFAITRQQEQALEASVSRLRQSALDEQARSVQYNILKRETDTNRSMYDALLQRFKEVSAQAGVTANNLTALDRAQLPRGPVSPRPMFNLGVALLLGLLISAILVFVRERLSDAIRTPDEVQTKLHVPLLNIVPKIDSKRNPLHELENKFSHFSEAYAALRTAIRLSSPDRMLRTLLVTSGQQGEGKSTTAFAMAHAFAATGTRTLLIDGDMRRPSLHRAFEFERGEGLSDLLAGQADFESVVRSVPVQNLSFMLSGTSPPNPADLLTGPTLPRCLEAAINNFDLVIIDGPPVLGLADAVLYAEAVEGIVFVAEAGRALHGQGKNAIQRLLSSGTRIIGAVLTKFNPKDSGYDAYYGYYYQYQSPKDSKERSGDFA